MKTGPQKLKFIETQLLEVQEDARLYVDEKEIDFFVGSEKIQTEFSLILDFPNVDIDLELSKLNVTTVEKIEILEKFDVQQEDIKRLKETLLEEGNKIIKFNWVWIIVGIITLSVVILLIFLTKRRKKIEILKVEENVKRRKSI